MSDEHTHEQQQEDNSAEVQELQRMVNDLSVELNQVRQEHAVSMTNELTALRQLIPYLMLENNTLRDALGRNNG